MGVIVSVTGGEKYKAVLQKIADIGLGVKAGIPKGATSTDGKSIPTYAAFNEFGTSRIPPRPFLQTTAKDQGAKWVATVAAQTQGNTTDPAAWKRAMVLTGETMKADIQRTIQSGSFAPNAPATVRAKARKGKVEPDHPLIDTGQMLASVWYEVVEK